MLPQQPDSKVIEKKSLEILESLLPERWILRHHGSHEDYGIDLDIEIVDDGGQVLGRFFKAQVKGKLSVPVGENGLASVSGIKQSTLLYWANLCRQTHVVLFLVDITDRKVYWAPVFWQAAKLYDAGHSSKTLKLPAHSLLNATSLPMLCNFVTSPLIPSVVRGIIDLLSEVPVYTGLYVKTGWYDPHCGLSRKQITTFKEFLGTVAGLCPAYSHQNPLLFRLEYWLEKSLKDFGHHLANHTVHSAMGILYPEYLKALRALQTSILEGELFWQTYDQSSYRSIKLWDQPPSLEVHVLGEWVTQRIKNLWDDDYDG